MRPIGLISMIAPCLRPWFIAGAILFACGSVEAQIIESVDTRVTNGETTVRLIFNTRLRYLSHLNIRGGRDLQIRLRRLDPGVAGEPSSRIVERPIGGSSTRSGLEEVRVGDLPTGPALFLRFSEPNSYSVRGSSDGLELVVVARPIGSKVTKGVRLSEPTREPPGELAPIPKRQGVADAEREKLPRYQVQLGVTRSTAAAERLWRSLTAAEPELLAGIRHEITRGTSSGRGPEAPYTLRTTPFDNLKPAAQLCGELRQRSHECFVVQAPPEAVVVAVPGAEPEPAPDAPKDTTAQAFAIDLAWSTGAFDPNALPVVDAFLSRRLYTHQARQDGQPGYRLRLGFFATRQQARQILSTVRGRYADARIVEVDFDERRLSAQTEITIPSKPLPSISERRGKLPPIKADRLEAIIRDARGAMTQRNYDRAVQLFTKLLEYPEHAHSQEAQELLGLARERKGQVAHAKAEYDTYLRLYPKGEGSDRVRQRLAAVLTSRAKPKKKLRTAKRETQEKSWETQLYGGLSQVYSRQERFTDLEGRVTDRSDLFTDLDLTARALSDGQEIKFQFVGGHAFNFLDETDANESRVSSLYFDGLDRNSGLSTRLGRQSQSTGGVLGRFDGGKVGYRLIPEVSVNLIGGFPLASTTSLKINEEKYFYGANVDLGRFADHWDFNLYAIEQQSDGILDRRAVGGEARFTDIENGSVFSLLDYDISYNVLNIALLSGNLRFSDQTTLNVILDYRRSPIQTTTNGLQGLQVGSLSKALATFSEDTIRDFAEDRTAISQSATLGASRPLDERFQISADATVSRLTDTTASGGVEATPGTGYEFLYSAQLIGSSVFTEADTSILSTSFADRDDSSTATMTLNSRFSVGKHWRLNPRLRGDYRWEDVDSNQNRLRILPAIKMEYRLARWARIEFDTGVEWSTQTFVDGTEESTSFFATLGYRVDY